MAPPRTIVMRQKQREAAKKKKKEVKRSHTQAATSTELSRRRRELAKLRYEKCMDEMEFRAKESPYKFFFTRLHLFDIWRMKDGVYADRTRHVFEVLKGSLPNVENMDTENLYKRVVYVCNKLRQFWKKKHSRAKMISAHGDWLNVLEECELSVAKCRPTMDLEDRILRNLVETQQNKMNHRSNLSPHRRTGSSDKVMEDIDKKPEELLPIEHEDVECRACLQKFDYEAGLLDIFQPWEPPWNGMGDTIAQDLANIANVDITSADTFSKMICQFCHQKLLEACSFIVNVRINDRLLRQRVETFHEQDNSWPKPIQVNQNINSDVFTTPMDVEIKQEVLSDDESYPNGADESFKEGVEGTDHDTFNNLDIKIEPEEIMQPTPIQITVNGTITHDQFEQNSILTNGDHKSPMLEIEKVEIKSEPKSEGEEVEPAPELSLECMLCAKAFQSVTGLKIPPVKKHHKNIAKKKGPLYNYTEEALKKAIHAVRCDYKNVSEVSRLYGVPRFIIQDSITGEAKKQPRRLGPEPVLGFAGEQQIMDWVVELATCGIPVSRDVLLENASNLIANIGKSKKYPEGCGQSWYQGFIKRHPVMNSRDPQNINKTLKEIMEYPIGTWYSGLESFLIERGARDIIEDKDRMLAADETEMPLCSKIYEVLAPKDRNIDTVKTGNEKETLTVLTMMTSSGKLCPPLIVFPYVKPPKEIEENMPDGWIITKSESGYMQSDIFYEYIAKNVNNWILENNIKKPVILFVDKIKSYMSIPLSKFCKENDIILYALHWNATHRANSKC